MSSMPETSQDSRLRWRCRRGMLELDLILNQFLDQGYDDLDGPRKALLDQLLDYPDQLLFDLLLGHMVSSDKEIAQLVSHIRGRVRP
jgi:antitoxin CptB